MDHSEPLLNPADDVKSKSPSFLKRLLVTLKNLVMPPPVAVYCCECMDYTPTGEVHGVCKVCAHKNCRAEHEDETRRVVCGQGKFNVSPVWLLLFVGLYLLGGIGNNVGVLMMGYRMPCYPEFLLYGSTFGYSSMFALFAIATGQSFRASREHHLQFAWLGLWTSLNGVLAQFAVPFVQPELANLVVQSSVPATWFLMTVMFKWKITPFHILCAAVLLSGLLVGVVPSLILKSSGGGGSIVSNPFWIVMTFLAALPAAAQTVYQERAFKELHAPIWVTLAYYNFYSLFFYLLSLPLTMTDYFGHGYSWNQMWKNQLEALQCYFGGIPETDYIDDATCEPGHAPTCFHGARLWVTIFTLGYVLMFGIGAVLLRVKSSALIANLAVLLTPLSGAVFWCKFIVQGQAQDPVWYVVVAVVFVVTGNILYERYVDVKTAPNDLVGRLRKNKFWNRVIIDPSRMSCCKGSRPATLVTATPPPSPASYASTPATAAPPRLEIEP